MKFFLGTHEVNWLEKTDTALFISRRRFERRKKFPTARYGQGWALDSGGFTELSKYGEWRMSALDYAELVFKLSEHVGGLLWATIQDWMCEPEILADTGLTVAEHQARTLRSYIELCDISNRYPGFGVRWVPVLQGWSMGDYFRHLEAYDKAGVDLRAPGRIVGVGSICRRQNTTSASNVLAVLHSEGLSLHAFGLKKQGLVHCAPYVFSADSMAWSFRARRDEFAESNDRNSLEYALSWRDELMNKIGRSA